jgi:hypothetical protein
VSAVEVSGPLGIAIRSRLKQSDLADSHCPPIGQMTLPLPPYLTAEHDVESQRVSLSVANAAIAQQRAMWGSSRNVN